MGPDVNGENPEYKTTRKGNCSSTTDRTSHKVASEIQGYDVDFGYEHVEQVDESSRKPRASACRCEMLIDFPDHRRCPGCDWGQQNVSRITCIASLRRKFME